MAFVNHSWAKNGRVQVSDQNPNQYRWQTTVSDDENVDLGDGTFAPYTWDGSVARFGRTELDVSAGGLLTFLGVEKINKIDYTLEGDFGSGFVDANMGGVPTVAVTENDDHLLIDLIFDGCEFRWQDVPGRTSQDGNLPVAFRVELRVQSGNTLRIAQYITSPMAHDIRIRFENRGMEPFSGTEDKRDYIRRRKQDPGVDDGNFIDVTLGVEIGNMILKWSDPESTLRTVNVTAQGQKRTLEVLMGPYTLAADQELVIVPDTWTSADITTDTDDGMEEGETTWSNNYDGDGWQIGDAGGDRDGGVRFTGLPSNIGDISTVDTGTHIDFYVSWSGGTTDVLYHFVEEANPDTWGSSNRPSQKTLTTNSVAETWTHPISSGSKTTAELGGASSPGQEWADTVTPVSTGAVSIVWMSDGNIDGARFQVEDSSSLSGGEHSCRLDLVYTVGGGGTTPRLATLGVGI